jgi:hypothetical protein
MGERKSEDEKEEEKDNKMDGGGEDLRITEGKILKYEKK